MAFTTPEYDYELTDTDHFATNPASETAARTQFQDMFDDILGLLGDLITELEDTTLGQSGAENIGAAAISGVTGTTIRAQIADLKAQIDAVSAGSVSDGSITTAKLATDAVTGAKIADEAIDSEHYVNGSIDTEHLSADCVNGTKIADDSIDSEHYVDGSIDTAHLSSGCITKAKIGAGALAWTQIVTDQALSAAASSLNTTSHVGYNEMYIQIKDQAGTTSELQGYAISLLQSSGEGNPKYVDIPVWSSSTPYVRTFTINAASIAWGTTTHPTAAVQKLSVFVR
jgi:hypothetical protein